MLTAYSMTSLPPSPRRTIRMKREMTQMEMEMGMVVRRIVVMPLPLVLAPALRLLGEHGFSFSYCM